MINSYQIIKASRIFDRILSICLGLASAFFLYISWGEGSIFYWILFAVSALVCLLSVAVTFDDPKTTSDLPQIKETYHFMHILALKGSFPLALQEKTYMEFLKKIRTEPECELEIVNFLAPLSSDHFNERDFRRFLHPKENKSVLLSINVFGVFKDKPDQIEPFIKKILEKNPPRPLKDFDFVSKGVSVVFGLLALCLFGFWVSLSLSIWSNLCFAIACVAGLLATSLRLPLARMLAHKFGYATALSLDEKKIYREFCATYLSLHYFDQANPTTREADKLKKLQKKEKLQMLMKNMQKQTDVDTHLVLDYLKKSGLWQKAKATEMRKHIKEALKVVSVPETPRRKM